MNAQEKDFDQYLKDTITTARFRNPESSIDHTYSIVRGKMEKSVMRDSIENRNIIRVSLVGLILVLLLNVSFIVAKENPVETKAASVAGSVSGDNLTADELVPFYLDNYLATLYEY